MRFIGGIFFALFILVPGCVGLAGTELVRQAVKSGAKTAFEVTPRSTKREAFEAVERGCMIRSRRTRARCECENAQLYAKLSTRQYRYYAAGKTDSHTARYGKDRRRDYGMSKNAAKSLRKAKARVRKSAVCRRAGRG